MNKVSRTYRLTQDTVDELEKLANDAGTTVTDAITRAIHAAANMKYDKNTLDAARKEAESAVARADELSRELDRTHDALTRAQESLQAAQVMQQQAVERADKAEQELRALPDPDAWKSKSLLDRIMRR